MKNNKYIDTDIMKIISSFAVLLIHVATCTEGEFIITPNLSILINTICRFSVPVFVMVSGRYMIGKNHTIKYILIKSLKLFIIMVSCSLIYMIHDVIINKADISTKEFINRLLTAPIHLWYIYMI